MENVKDLEDLLAMGCEVKKRLNDAKQSEEEVYVKVENDATIRLFEDWWGRLSRCEFKEKFTEKIKEVSHAYYADIRPDYRNNVINTEAVDAFLKALNETIVAVRERSKINAH